MTADRPALRMLRGLLPAGAGGVLVAAVLAPVLREPDPLAARVLTEDPRLLALLGLLQAVLASTALARPATRRFGVIAATVAAASTTGAALTLAVRTTGELSGLLLWPADLLTVLGCAWVSLILLVFPDGRFLRGAWGVVGRAYLVSIVLIGAAMVLCPLSPLLVGDPRAARPADVLAADPTVVPVLADVLAPALFPLQVAATLCFAVAVATPARRYLLSAGAERDRMRWVLWGVVVLTLIVAGSFLVAPSQVDRVLSAAMVAVNAVAMTLAVVAPRWVSVEDLLVRTLAYGGVGVLLLGLDLAVVTGLTSVLGGRVDERDLLLVVLVVSAVVYAPLRVRLAEVARRLLRGDRDDPYGAVAGLAANLETAADADAQLAAVARAVAAAFGVAYVAVEIDRPDGGRVVATRGTRPAGTRTLPVRYRDETVGRLLLPARGLRNRLSRSDERLLGDLVRQAATFVRHQRLTEELQRNRERLVVAREEERRRIRRDLHDDLAPTLGGVVFEVDTATVLLDRDPPAAQRRIAETTAHLRDVVARVRRLVHDLRPPALDELGLVGALRQHAAGLPVATTVTTDADTDADARGPLPAAVEVAAYRITVGALDNVVRHASAGSATVTLARTDARLVVEVRDDGVGIPPEVEAGGGLVGLRERAAELGGRVEVTCPPGGGTVLRATIPVRPA